ncbi:hypothetical protein OFN43_31255, partial [Escherichia coli]|nr:hypothetical protein [Escherichia coli]
PASGNAAAADSMNRRRFMVLCSPFSKKNDPWALRAASSFHAWHCVTNGLDPKTLIGFSCWTRAAQRDLCAS